MQALTALPHRPQLDALHIELPGISEPETLVARRRRLPEPGPNQVVVRMEATGVSFAEQQMRRGKYYDQPSFPFVPGYDLVGVVERVGPAAPSGEGAPRVSQRVARAHEDRRLGPRS